MLRFGWRRVASVGLIVCLGAAFLAVPSNASTPQGVGSAGGSTALAGVDAGNLLKLLLVGEQSVASIDPASGTPSATETLSPLTVASGAVPALNAISVPSVSTTSTGAADHKDTALLDLATLPQPAPILSGSINPASLTSVVDTNGAQASLDSTLANLGVLGGVVKIDSAKVQLGGIAGPGTSNSTRSVSIDGITVLDLRAVLQLVGLDLNKLPLSTLAGLIDQLGLLPTLNSLTGQNFGSAGDIVNALTTPAITAAQTAVNTAQSAVNTAQTGVDTAQGALTTAQSNLTSANQAASSATTALNSAVSAASGVLCNVFPNDPLCVAVTQAQSALATAQAAQTAAQTAFNTAQAAVTAAQGVLTTATNALNAAIATLNSVLGQLKNVLDGVANTLDLEPLLRVEGIQVGSIANAADTVANSSATTLASIGDVKVGGIDLGGIDVNATLDQVQALAGQVTSTVNSVLGTISPQLANLVKVDLFKRATDVSQSGNYVNAVAGITGLVATVTPPDICSVLNDVLSKLPVGGNSLPGVSLPALPVGSVLSAISSVVSCNLTVTGLNPDALVPNIPALLSPITLTAAQANSVAAFTPTQSSTTTTSTTAPGTSSNPGTPGSPTSTTTTGSPLARTGNDAALLLIFGALLAAAALGTRRTLIAAQARR
ncbi:MAG TPA: hypothetical protein VGZ52_00670 [Acidimicrobiales bacterium]|jgi:hypothetical protein|nr:hypothetical protein [Acidimicrobiales bacterium]